MTTPISEAKGVPPSEYSTHLERTLQQQEARERARAKPRAFWVAVGICAAITLLCIAAKEAK